MKTKLIASFILVVFGVGFLMAAYQFAPLAYAAPSVPVDSHGYQSGVTVVEFAYGLPAVTFTITGVLGILAGVVIASLALCFAPTPTEPEAKK